MFPCKAIELRFVRSMIEKTEKESDMDSVLKYPGLLYKEIAISIGEDGI